MLDPIGRRNVVRQVGGEQMSIVKTGERKEKLGTKRAETCREQDLARVDSHLSCSDNDSTLLLCLSPFAAPGD